jgi:hypothetical protein
VNFLRGPESVLIAAAFTPDGRSIVTSERDGPARKWGCDICGATPELLSLAERRLAATGRTLTDAERTQYLG